ncbi:MAG: hypothetical protein U0350_02315 [Caldilineaceae bacterium]
MQPVNQTTTNWESNELFAARGYGFVVFPIRCSFSLAWTVTAGHGLIIDEAMKLQQKQTPGRDNRMGVRRASQIFAQMNWATYYCQTQD